MISPAMAGRLLGRAIDLAKLDAAFADAETGDPQVVLLSGAAGAGKTALLTVFANHIAAHAGTVLWPSAFGRPGVPAYWLWRQPAAPDTLLDAWPSPPDRLAIVDRLADRLRSISAAAPVVLVLDDVDNADSSSLTTLPKVVRALGRSHLLVCCAFTSGPAASRAWRAAQSALESTASTHDMVLTGLAADDVRRLLIAGGVPAPDPELVDRVVTTTAGNPLFVTELTRQLTDPRPSPSNELLPGTLAELVAARLEATAETVRRVLAAASILGDTFRVGEVARALNLPATVCLDALEEAGRIGIIARLTAGEAEFRHDALRAIVEARLPAAERADLHRRVAETLEVSTPYSLGDNLGVLAYHWTAAAAGGASTEASLWARRAADESMHSLAYEQAEQLYSVALEHAGDLSEVDRARLLLARGTAGFRSGHLIAAREACAAAVAVARRRGSNDVLASAALTLEPVGEPAWDGDIYAWCQEALAAPETPGSTQVRLLARLSQAATYLRLDDEADRTSADAVRRAAALNECDVQVDALIARQLVRCGPDDVDELGALADRMLALGISRGRPDLELWGRLWRVDTHWYTGRLSAIAGEIASVQRCAERAGGPYAHWHLMSLRGLLALARAEFNEGRWILGEAMERMARIGHPAVHGASVSFGLLIGHHCGYSVELMDNAAWEFGADVRWDLYARLARAFMLVDRGRLDEAAVSYHRCGDPGSWHIPRGGRLVGLAVGARVASSIGAVDDVRTLRDWLLPYRGRFVAAGGGGTNFLGPVDLALGRCDASLGQYESACRHFETAIAMCRAIGAPGFAVEADTELATAHATSGNAAAAAVVVRRTLPLARVLGMTPWVNQLIGLDDRRSQDPLTAREREVAALVAKGLSNRTIAERLVISERTAGNHVQHILGKLGFSNRAQIAAWGAARVEDE